MHQVGPLPGRVHEDRQADGQHESVQAADEHQHGRGRGRDQDVGDERNGDEGDRGVVALALGHVRLEGGQERDRGVGRADDAGRQEHRAEQAEADVARGGTEGLSRRVGATPGEVDDDAARDHAQDREKQDVPEDAGDDDAIQRRTGDRADALGADRTFVEEAVSAGIGDVTTDRPADDRRDGGEVDRLAAGRRRGGAVDHGVEAEAGAADVSYVEEQTADDDEDGQKIAGSRDRRVRDRRGPHLGDDHHPPDVRLNDEVDQD